MSSAACVPGTLQQVLSAAKNGLIAHLNQEDKLLYPPLNKAAKVIKETIIGNYSCAPLASASPSA